MTSNVAGKLHPKAVMILGVQASRGPQGVFSLQVVEAWGLCLTEELLVRVLVVLVGN
jgi:hypothetical protein